MSGYPMMMQESIKKLEQTRSFRLSQEIPRMPFAEREALLHEWHPDYRPDSIKEVRIGPNKGEKLTNKLVDLLEGRSCVDPDQVNLNQIDYDVDILVIGAGGGGVSAALIAQEKGARVLMATKLRIGDSNTVMAEGGIAAATQANDSLDRHFLDTMGGGRFKNKRDVVSTLVHDAPLMVEWLKDLGCMFDTKDNGDFVVSFAGGHQRRRVHSCKDLSGLEFMRVIRDEFRNQKIPLLEYTPAVELLLDEEGKCTGALLQNMETGEYLVVKAKAVILATGGIGRLHPCDFPTTNHYGATADGLVIAYRAGANLLHMGNIQFHPTGAMWPEQMLGQLITEACRGNGAQLVNVKGERFINELETRDTVSSGILREVQGRGNGIPTPTGRAGIWLDTPLINIRGDAGKLDRMFAGIVHRFHEYGINVREEPILIFPTQHYQNGGVEIDPEARTKVPGLYAAGECSGGVQGINRLGGNSLLDIFVFGHRSAHSAVTYIKSAQVGAPSLQHVKKYHQQLKDLGIHNGLISPILLPDYTREEVKVRSANGASMN
ncbi:FAD-binding protein [Candidatus Formimonas warabiya]|uniref:Succinate dehydrogenase/fumarate reductase flavoprotein subunit n=1 Tax=Formimonas warabiya TaxID=1761012 RepID=A0A3G1KRL4_FORW1|nr:FAD-binding protein [Candidatus Formimonas warabiya]ATW25123.1 succinate dehydrogenase/fumarate reductase flavoprotein subunit [Candidatus Formimonas warabiya]